MQRPTNMASPVFGQLVPASRYLRAGLAWLTVQMPLAGLPVGGASAGGKRQDVTAPISHR